MWERNTYMTHDCSDLVTTDQNYLELETTYKIIADTNLQWVAMVRSKWKEFGEVYMLKKKIERPFQLRADINPFVYLLFSHAKMPSHYFLNMF